MDRLRLSEQQRGRMLQCMKAVYALHLKLFDELDGTCPSTSSSEGKKMPVPPPLSPANRKIALGELRQHGGTQADKLGVPLLTSVLGRVYDVSSSKKSFGAGGAYELFAGHDVTYNLAVMSLKRETLDKFTYETDEEEKLCLAEWIAHFDNRFGRPIGNLSDRTHPIELSQLPRASKIPFARSRAAPASEGAGRGEGAAADAAHGEALCTGVFEDAALTIVEATSQVRTESWEERDEEGGDGANEASAAPPASRL